MKLNKKTLWIQILAIIGLGLSIELAIIYYNANYQAYSLSSFCSVNEFIDCDGAARTSVSQFLGIPLAYWGIFLYVIFLFLTFTDKLKNIKFLKFLEVFKNPKAYISTIGTISFLCSMILAKISIFDIHKLCVLCMITYFIDLTIALIASDGMFKNIVQNFKTTIFDFIEGAKKYKKTFVALLMFSVAFLSYSNITYDFIPHMKRHREIMKYKKMKYNPYRVKGNVLGNPNGTVVVNLYSDYVCPLCYIHNIMLHKAIKEFHNIKVIHHNYPFDKICNSNVSATMHPNACFMSKAALAAKNQDNYWEMSSLLYENQPKNLDEVLKLVKKLNFDEEKFLNDFYSKEIDTTLINEINEAAKQDIDSTPSMIINGKTYVGVKPYQKLKEILKENGANDKK